MQSFFNFQSWDFIIFILLYSIIILFYKYTFFICNVSLNMLTIYKMLFKLLFIFIVLSYEVFASSEYINIIKCCSHLEYLDKLNKCTKSKNEGEFHRFNDFISKVLENYIYFTWTRTILFKTPSKPFSDYTIDISDVRLFYPVMMVSSINNKLNVE